jgi:hypothetical protein
MKVLLQFRSSVATLSINFQSIRRKRAKECGYATTNLIKFSFFFVNVASSRSWQDAKGSLAVEGLIPAF